MNINEKICIQCEIPRPIDSFYKGRNVCKSCYSDRNQTYRSTHKQYFVEKGAQWYQENKEQIIIEKKVYRQEHKEQIATYKKAYRRQHMERILQYETQWRKQNQDWITNWNASNRHIINAISAKRRAALLNATPPWLTQEHMKEIEEFYLLAQELAWLNDNGKPFHVDHIIPLQGEGVCGLHVPWNLQLLPALVNIRKSNKF